MNVNDKIRMVRETKNWSQEDMAVKLNMSTNGYTKIERGETSLNLVKLEKIAAIFGMDVIELMSVSDKSVVCLISENSSYSSNYYGASSELRAELEKYQLMVAQKDELLRAKEREIATLQSLVDALKASS